MLRDGTRRACHTLGADCFLNSSSVTAPRKSRLATHCSKSGIFGPTGSFFGAACAPHAPFATHAQSRTSQLLQHTLCRPRPAASVFAHVDTAAAVWRAYDLHTAAQSAPIVDLMLHGRIDWEPAAASAPRGPGAAGFEWLRAAGYTAATPFASIRLSRKSTHAQRTSLRTLSASLDLALERLNMAAAQRRRSELPVAGAR